MRPLLLPALALAALAGCSRGPAAPDAAAAMHDAHAHDAPVATGAVAGVDTTRTEAREVTYATLDGRPVRGYLARPLDAGPEGALPGLVVVHEWWGLNDNVRLMTRRLAAQGYVALAVDLYDGGVAATPDEAQALMQRSTERAEPLMRTLDEAITHLRVVQGAPRVGVVGWCFGGGWALRTALALPEQVDAAVMYYGRVVTDPRTLTSLDAPLLGLFGGADASIPVADVRAMEAVLREQGNDVEVHVYDGAGHGFANPSGRGYDAAAAEDAWRRTTAFLAGHLKGGG
jgi:carboxymethylenebutenolidase